jgi:transcriptional regulator with XRE-family HTH domain
MTVPRIDPTQLQVQLLIRGLNKAELAQLAGVTPGTVSRAAAGRTVSSSTLARIVRALDKVPVMPTAAALLVGGQET